uniref:Uncharacterized protein n=1 Tax=Paramormyrops kingsleyae TaxID=1676925 RepID=A0A3B3R6I5_9TELE
CFPEFWNVSSVVLEGLVCTKRDLILVKTTTGKSADGGSVRRWPYSRLGMGALGSSAGQSHRKSCDTQSVFVWERE